MKGKKTGQKVVKTNKKNNEKTKLIMGIAMMVLAVAVAGGTYAYYQSTITGTVSGTILAWDCNNGTGTNGNVALGNLKPGTQGSFVVKAYTTNFKFDATFTFNSGTNVPANFKLYKDSAYSTAITYGTAAWTDTNVAKGTTGVSHTVYWKWPIGTSAESAPATGTSNLTLTIPYTITCKESNTVQG